MNKQSLTITADYSYKTFNFLIACYIKETLTAALILSFLAVYQFSIPAKRGKLTNYLANPI